jgi:soluble lytic murein transglycosylase
MGMGRLSSFPKDGAKPSPGVAAFATRSRSKLAPLAQPAFIPNMFRFLRLLLLILLAGAIVAAGLKIGSSPDPLYAAHEIAAFGRFNAYDGLIAEAAQRHGIEPALLKAIIWRESRFHPDQVGGAGERGLMQVTEAAAADWVRIQKIDTFISTDLFEPRTNLDAGAWYLKRALDRWKEKADPVPFALAEYNAGASRVDRWVAATGAGTAAEAPDLLQSMDFPGTRRYIEEIIKRAAFYRKQQEG